MRRPTHRLCHRCRYQEDSRAGAGQEGHMIAVAVAVAVAGISWLAGNGGAYPQRN